MSLQGAFMNIIKNGMIALTLSLFAVPAVHAKPAKLPFVGSAEVNFYGGSATARAITIKKNGTITIMGENSDGEAVYDYSGKFSNPLKVADTDGSVYYYQFNGNKSISLLDKNKKVLQDCQTVFHDSSECTQEIEVF